MSFILLFVNKAKDQEDNSVGKMVGGPLFHAHILKACVLAFVLTGGWADP